MMRAEPSEIGKIRKGDLSTQVTGDEIGHPA